MKCNQPAFPVALDGAFINSENDLKPFAGMSLRDWFAGMALAGSIQAIASGQVSPEHAARDNYAMADAMLKEREK